MVNLNADLPLWVENLVIDMSFSVFGRNVS